LQTRPLRRPPVLTCLTGPINMAQPVRRSR
jgi:hypothetical protein